MKFKSFTPAVILSCLSTYVFAVSNDCSNADDCVLVHMFLLFPMTAVMQMTVIRKLYHLHQKKNSLQILM